MSKERLCVNCCFCKRDKNSHSGICVMDKKRGTVLVTESATEKNCKHHLYLAETKEIELNGFRE